jgi:hypothetical protein
VQQDTELACCGVAGTGLLSMDSVRLVLCGVMGGTQ